MFSLLNCMSIMSPLLNCEASHPQTSPKLISEALLSSFSLPQLSSYLSTAQPPVVQQVVTLDIEQHSPHTLHPHLLPLTLHTTTHSPHLTPRAPHSPHPGTPNGPHPTTPYTSNLTPLTPHNPHLTPHALHLVPHAAQPTPHT